MKRKGKGKGKEELEPEEGEAYGVPVFGKDIFLVILQTLSEKRDYQTIYRLSQTCKMLYELLKTHEKALWGAFKTKRKKEIQMRKFELQHAKGIDINVLDFVSILFQFFLLEREERLKMQDQMQVRKNRALIDYDSESTENGEDTWHCCCLQILCCYSGIGFLVSCPLWTCCCPCTLLCRAIGGEVRCRSCSVTQYVNNVT
jgi:hypothetical protein